MKVRLHIEDSLFEGAKITPTHEATHYLQHVMRMKTGDRLRLFNAHSGEYEAQLTQIHKKGVVLEVKGLLREGQTRPFLGLAFTPLKPGPLSFLLEKATELGVSDLYPVLTRYTSVRHFNEVRAAATVREAAEQCERLDVPRVHPLQDLGAFMGGLDEKSVVFACVERAKEALLWGALPHQGGANPLVLVGPEGGFETGELTFLRAHAQVHPVSLGPLVLRAETAALAALALFHAAPSNSAHT